MLLENWIAASRKLKQFIFITLYKYQLKVDLNIRPETLKLVQERAGNTLEVIGIGNDLLSRTQVENDTT
jgi:hypothetical protein